MHLLQVAVGLIPCSLSAFVPIDEQWVVPALLKDFHLGMVDRQAEVLRRRDVDEHSSSSFFEEGKNGIHNTNSCFHATATVASSSVETVAAFAPDSTIQTQLARH